jgi:hypothetical protein
VAAGKRRQPPPTRERVCAKLERGAKLTLPDRRWLLATLDELVPKPRGRPRDWDQWSAIGAAVEQQMKNRRGSIENVALEVGEQFPNSGAHRRTKDTCAVSGLSTAPYSSHSIG